MTNLTEQWDKGELPEGWYYVKDIHNEERLDRYFKETDNFEYLEDWEVDEVLAGAPSYEQWIMTKNLSERAHIEMYKARGEKVKLENENTKLKEKYGRAIWWLKEIITCHRYTPISTSEKALKELLGEQK